MDDPIAVFLFLMAVGLLTFGLAWLRVRWVQRNLADSIERRERYEAGLRQSGACANTPLTLRSDRQRRVNFS